MSFLDLQFQGGILLNTLSAPLSSLGGPQRGSAVCGLPHFTARGPLQPHGARAWEGPALGTMLCRCLLAMFHNF